MKKYLLRWSVQYALALGSVLVFWNPAAALAFGPGSPAYNVSGVTHDWTFNNTSTDYVGGNDIFSTNGSPTFTAISNVYPYARNYPGDGVSNDVAHGTLDGYKAVSFWVKFLTTPTTTSQIYTDGAGATIYNIAVNASGSAVFSITGNIAASSTASNITDTAWHSVIFNSDEILHQTNTYIDGVLNNTINSTSTWAFTNAGKVFGNTAHDYILQDFAFYGTSLTAGNVQYLVNGNSPTNCDSAIAAILSTPSNGSTIVNDFPSWIVSTPLLVEGCSYRVQVSYLPQVGSVTGGQDFSSGFSVTPSFSPSWVSVPKAKNIWNFYQPSSTPINYVAQVQNTADGVIVGSQSGTFTLRFASSSSITAPPGFDPAQQCGGVCQGFGTLGGGSIATPSSTIAVIGNQCVAPGGFTDIGGGISYGFCQIINFLFVPGQATQQILAGDMDTLQTVPPFSWFFRTNAQIAADSNTTAGLTPNLGVSYTIMNGIGTGTSSLTILPADLTSNQYLSGNNFVNDYYNFVLTFCILLAILFTYKIIL